MRTAQQDLVIGRLGTNLVAKTPLVLSYKASQEEETQLVDSQLIEEGADDDNEQHPQVLSSAMCTQAFTMVPEAGSIRLTSFRTLPLLISLTR